MPAAMTRRQRLLAALRREPVDRVPISPRLTAFLGGLHMDRLEAARKFDFDPYIECRTLDSPLNDLYGTSLDLPEVKAEVQTRRDGEKTLFQRTFRTPAGTIADELVLADPGPVYGPAPSAEWIEPLVKTRDNVSCLRHLLPDPATSDVKRFRQIEKEWGERGLVVARPTVGADEIAISAMEVGRAMLLLYDDPGLFDEVLRVADDWHTAAMKVVLEAGARVIFDPMYHMSLSTGWSPAFYREKVAPMIRRHVDLVHAYDGIHVFYDDGRIMNSVDAMVMAGIDALQTVAPPPSGDADLPTLKRRFGACVCFWGGVDLIRIRFGTADEVARLTQAALETLAPGGGFILGTSDSIRESTPPENVYAFCRTGRRYAPAR